MWVDRERRGPHRARVAFDGLDRSVFTIKAEQGSGGLCFLLDDLQCAPIGLVAVWYIASLPVPLLFDAAILSRMRSAVTSRSNRAKDRKTFSVSRPMPVAGLNDCVTDTKEASAVSSRSTGLAKSASERVKWSIFQTPI